MSHSPVIPVWSAPARLLPDSRLTRLAREGDQRAFEAIFRRHHAELYRYCRAILSNDHDAQDALQNTMAAALSALPGEKRDIPLRPWLFRVAHNEAISIARRRSRDGMHEEPELVAPSAQADAEERERLRTLVGDLAALPDRKRGALVMRELSGLSYADIAAALSISEGAARQTVYEAREVMREAELGREESCRDVREVISLEDGRKLRSRRIRAHLRACEGCSDFRSAIARRQGDLQLLAPPISAAAATALLGGGGLLGGGATVAGAGGAATGASMLGKAAAVLAIAAAGTGVAGVTGAVDVPGLSANDDSSPPATVSAPASASGAQAGEERSGSATASSRSHRGDGRGGSGARSNEDGNGAGSGGDGRGASSAAPPANAGSGSSGQGAPAGGSDGITGPPPQANGYGPPATAGTGTGNAGGNSATSQGVAPPKSESGTAHSNAGTGTPPAPATGPGAITD